MKLQYDVIISVGKFYTNILERFSDWFIKICKENEARFEQLEKEARSFSERVAQEHTEKIMLAILSGEGYSSGGRDGSFAVGTGSQSTGEDSSKTDTQSEKEMVDKAVCLETKELVKELDSQEKIRAFKQYIIDCETHLKAYQREEDKGKKKGLLSKFFSFIKNGAVKYGKSIAKALAILIPILCPQGGMAISLIAALPDIIFCFDGTTHTEMDVNKLALGLDLLKAIGVSNFPEDSKEISVYIEMNINQISEAAMKSVIKSEIYRDLVGIDETILGKKKNRSRYEAFIGKSIKEVPDRISAYATDLKNFSPDKLNKLRPMIDGNEIKGISRSIENHLNKRIDGTSKKTIFEEIPSLKKQLDSKGYYIEFVKGSKIEELIKELNDIIGKEKGFIRTEEVEGRYNKDIIKMI